MKEEIILGIHTSRLGTGLSTMKFHSKTPKGYCRSCKSYNCYMTAYIPLMPREWEWTWDAMRSFMLAEVV